MKADAIFDFSYEHYVNKVMHPEQHIFDFYSNTEKNKIGILVCHKSELNIRPNYNDNVLAVDYIEVTNKNQGVGTKILKFAEEYSKQIGCKGFMALKADGSYTPERIPHVFYRKFGFSTLENKTDKKLDKFVKRKINATNNDFPCMLMHYPILDKKNKCYKKISLLFKKLLQGFF